MIKLFMMFVCILFTAVSCSNNEEDKYWLEATSEVPAAVQSCQAKVVYSDVLKCYVLAPVEQSICGTYYVVNNKESGFLEAYKGTEVTFSGQSQKARLCPEGDAGLSSTDYFLLELEDMN